MRTTIVIAASLAVGLLGSRVHAGEQKSGASVGEREGTAMERSGGTGQQTTGAGGEKGDMAKSAPMDVTAGAIAKSPTTYYGKSVQVKAEVENVYGAHIFTLDEDQVLAGPDVLVLIPAALQPATEDEMVTVRGPVRQFTRTEIERDYEWFEANDFGDPDLLVRFESRPVIIADSVRTASGAEIVSATKKSTTEKRAETQDEGSKQHGDAPAGR